MNAIKQYLEKNIYGSSKFKKDEWISQMVMPYRKVKWGIKLFDHEQLYGVIVIWDCIPPNSAMLSKLAVLHASPFVYPLQMLAWKSLSLTNSTVRSASARRKRRRSVRPWSTPPMSLDQEHLMVSSAFYIMYTFFSVFIHIYLRISQAKIDKFIFQLWTSCLAKLLNCQPTRMH